MHSDSRSSANSAGALRLALSLAVLLCLVPATLPAQDVNNKTNIGLPENGVFSGSTFDLVQMNNKDLHIEIPLWSTKGRGLNFFVKYAYDNKGFYFTTTCNHWGICTDHVMQEPGNSMQFKLVTPFGYASTSKITLQQCTQGNTQVTITNRTWREPDGTKHHMLPDPAIAGGNSCWGDLNGKAYADDGSGWTYGIRKDGTAVGTQLIRDTNGNQLIKDGTTGVVTDTLGRVVPMDGSYYDSSGTLRQLAITYVSVPVQTAVCGFGGSDYCNEYSGTFSMPQQITLPNGMSYTFAYAQNGYGEPISVTLPTGGQISWTWNDPIDEGGRSVATRTVTVDGQSYTWTYNNANGGVVTDPLGNDTVHTCTFLKAGFRDWSVTYANAVCQINDVKYYAGSAGTGTLMKTIHTDFSTSAVVLPVRETTTLNDQSLVTKVETSWDINSTWSGTNSWKNPTSRSEYAYGTGAAGSLVRKTTFSYLSNSTYRNLNITDRVTNRSVLDGSLVLKALTQYTYDGTGLTATSGAPNHDYTGFGSSFLTRGNATQVKNWLTGSTFFFTNNTYNDLGNLLTSTDPGGHVTTYSYTDDWANAACVSGGNNTYGYVTQITNHLNQRAQTRFFSCTGLPERTRDENDILASLWGRIFTYDQMSRTLSVVQADGGETDYTYDDAAPLSVTRSSRIDSTQNLVSTTLLDGLGRASQSQLTSDPQGTVYVDTTYDALGRTATVTNPYRSGDTTYVTTTKYDALGRVIKVIPTDGTDTTNNVTSVYTANTVTVTDQAGKKRKSQTDALGRLVAVWEPDAGGSFLYETDYQYDTLDNLTRVDQKGNDANSANWRTRTFTYDALSRLTQAFNPESGTINYTYDSDSNLLTKVAPLPNQTGTATVTTTYAYDSLHRLTQKSYSDGTTATVKHGYDAVALTGCATSPPGLTITNGIGRRTAMCEASGATAWSYDSGGRTLIERRKISGITKDISYSYNLGGSLASMTYPSGRVVNYAYNGAAHPLSAKDTANSINYATAATYAPHGALSGVTYGQVAGGFPGIFNALAYNKRLQPTDIMATTGTLDLTCTNVTGKVLHFNYNFALGSADNGNVQAISNCRDTSRGQNFTYDQLNRVATAISTATSGTNCWGENFGYDIWGNLLTRSAGQGGSGCTYEALTVVATTKNQISGFCYDSAGNLTRQAACGSTDYTYDAENRVTSTGGVTYTYDGDGKRVKKSNGKLYWTGVGSDPLTETDFSGNATADYIFFSGKRIARFDLPAATVHYYFSDHLGSHSVVSNSDATTIEQESDYYPFGGERPVTSGPNTYKFTGKERDAESGLDNFAARYNASSLGRFLSPDLLGGRLIDPQTLNKYSYVRNNPVNLLDPTGMYICKDSKDCSSDQDKAFEAARQEALNSGNDDVVRAASAYGGKAKDNGVTVVFGDPGEGNNGVTTHDLGPDPGNKVSGLRAEETVTIRDGLSGADLNAAMAEEGSHAADAQEFVASITPTDADYSKNLTTYETEMRGHLVTNSVLARANEARDYDCGVRETCKLGAGVQNPAGAIERILARPPYNVTPENQGARLYPRFVPPNATTPH